MLNPENLLGALALGIADAQARCWGQSEAALAILNTLHEAPGSSISALAAVTARSHSGTVRTVEALEGRGFIARQPGRDARTASLVLTEAGAAARAGLQAGRQAVLAAALAPLDAGERAAFAGLAARILAGLTTSRAAGDHICRLCDEAACGPACPVEARAVALDGPPHGPRP